jgi:formamidopyrimidine-DNA glycosylase
MDRLHTAALKQINKSYQAKIDQAAPRYKFTVYNQRSCGDCGKAVKREKTADKRTSHWCPACIKQTQTSEPDLPDDWHWH